MSGFYRVRLSSITKVYRDIAGVLRGTLNRHTNIANMIGKKLTFASNFISSTAELLDWHRSDDSALTSSGQNMSAL